MASHAPLFPADVATDYHDGPWGRMRSRAVGQRRDGVPEVVLVQGLGVSDYLLPGVGALGGWTRAHLLDLPGLSGGGDPPHELDVPQYGRCVADWLRARIPDAPVLLAGHSSGTQVAAHAATDAAAHAAADAAADAGDPAAAGGPDVAGLVLASPTVDPVARGWVRVLVRWLRDGRREPSGLLAVHLPEWRRAGPRRILHLVRVHLADRLEDTLSRVDVPVLVIRGRRDVIGTAGWARELASLTTAGAYVEVDGAHAFPWRDPYAWSAPLRRWTGGAPP